MSWRNGVTPCIDYHSISLSDRGKNSVVTITRHYKCRQKRVMFYFYYIIRISNAYKFGVSISIFSSFRL